MEKYVIDTHALVWYLANDPRIGPTARNLLYRCDAGEIQAIVPAIVLIEFISVITNPRKEIRGQRPTPQTLFTWLDNNPQFIIHSLDYTVIKDFADQRASLLSLREDHDRIIVITSRIEGYIPIITRDPLISSVAPTLW